MTDSDRCPACGGHSIEIVDFPFPLFRHLDFTRIESAGGKLGECSVCGTIFRVAAPDVLAGIDACYKTEEYAAHDEVHAISLPGSGEPVSASRVQAAALVGFLPPRAPRILDFGCFNGRLLKEFESLRPDASLVGYDVGVRTGFPTGSAFSLVCGDWHNIEGPFDLVCLSHSIQYVRDIGSLLARIHDWIGVRGTVFIQTPDVTKKVCALLLGDVHYHFSRLSLEALLGRHGFQLLAMPDLPFPRDVIVLARAGAASAPRRQIGPSARVLGEAVRHIATFADAVANHGRAEIHGVLGTTIEAGFVDELLNSRLRFFVDENADKIGQSFRGRDVISPTKVPSGARVLVPLGDQSGRVAARLSDRLPAEFVAV